MTVIITELEPDDELYQKETMIKTTKTIYTQSSAIYGMAFLGALIYFIQHAHTFWEGILGFFKAAFWPSVLVYKLLEFLKL